MDRRQWLVIPVLLSLAGCSATTAAGGPLATLTPWPTQVVTSASTPSATATTATSTTDEPSAAEVKYLAEVRPDAGEDETDADLLTEGHQACAFYRGAESPPDGLSDDEDETPPKPASDREVAQFFLDDNGSDDAAVKYLCPKLLDELAWAKAGFTEGDTEVGGKNGIKPGQYHAEGPVSDCYWERVTSGGSTRANDFVKYAPKGVTVTVRSSDGGINTQGCGSWLPVKRP